MSRVRWDAPGEKKYEVGVDHCVLYPVNTENEYTPGVAWNGIIQVAETPEGGEPNKQYADNIPYLVMMSAEELGGTIEAYMYPKEWEACDGSAELAPGIVIGQQTRKTFGLCYRTKVGDDVNGDTAGYKYHLLYGAKVSPSERTYETINDSPEPITFSWEYTTTPVSVEGFNPTALLVINSIDANPEKLKALEDILYGTDAGEGGTASDPRLPLPDEVKALFADAAPTVLRAARDSYKVNNSAPILNK